MSTSTDILLPLHVRSERLLDVVCKIMNIPYKIQPLQTKNADVSQPCSETNSWHISFEGLGKTHGFLIIPMGQDLQIDMSMSHLRFPHMGPRPASWAFFQETEYEEHKMLMPNASVFAVAVGRRLVGFFGGVLKFTGEYKDHVVDPELAVFPPKTNGQDSDDRFYQFYNALAALPRLQTADMEWAKTVCGFDLDDEDKEIMTALHALDMAEIEAATSPGARPRSPKIM